MRSAYKLAVAAMAAALSLPAHAAEECGPLRVVATVDLAHEKDGGRVALALTLAGQPELMLLDTGAYATSLTPRAVDALKLVRSRSNTSIRDILGNSSDEIARIPDMALGRLKAENVNVFVLPDADDSQYEPHSDSPASMPRALAGVFGSDFLRPYDVDLDFTAMKMRLISQAHCEGKVIYWKPEVFAIVPFDVTNSGGILFSMTLDGKDMHVLLDTGATESMMRADVARRLFDLAPEHPDPHSVINNQAVPGLFEHRFATLATDGFAIRNPAVTIYPDVADTQIKASQAWYEKSHGTQRADLVLGMRELTQLHIYIAYGERKLYLSPAAAAPSP
jgi:predicted aspartyl protease